MSEVNITSDLTPKGTKVTIDGKAGKGKITNVYFSLDYLHTCCSCHCVPCACDLEPIPCVTCYYTVEEKDEESGTEKCTTYRISKRGDDEAEVEDSTKTKGPSPEAILDFLKKKMQGKI